MNVDRLIRMGMRMLMRKGINKGVQMAASRGKKPEEMTPEEQAQAKNAQQTARQAQKSMRLARRFMK